MTLQKHAGMKPSWLHGPAAGAVQLKDQFLEEHDLQPVRICVQGPPAVGKTSIADKLAYYYRVQHITETVIVTIAPILIATNMLTTLV